jgi:hypothetical protein
VPTTSDSAFVGLVNRHTTGGREAAPLSQRSFNHEGDLDSHRFCAGSFACATLKRGLPTHRNMNHENTKNENTKGPGS